MSPKDGTFDSRRALLRWLAVPVVSAGGCVEFDRADGQVDLSIRNRDDETHDVLVAIATDDSTVEFRERFALHAGETTTQQAVVDAGTYVVTVDLDDSPEETHHFTMASCEDNTIYVTIDTNATPTIDQVRCR